MRERGWEIGRILCAFLKGGSCRSSRLGGSSRQPLLGSSVHDRSMSAIIRRLRTCATAAICTKYRNSICAERTLIIVHCCLCRHRPDAAMPPMRFTSETCCQQSQPFFRHRLIRAAIISILRPRWPSLKLDPSHSCASPNPTR